MDSAEIRNALERLTANASRELLVKQPHWGDAILCDGLLYAAAPLRSDAPASVECDVVGFYELGDHSVVVGKVTDAHVKRDAEALTMKETGWNYGG